METQTSTSNINWLKMIDDRIPGIKGTWELVYTPVGTMGAEGFGGTTIQGYQHPKTHRTIYRVNPDGQPLPYLFVDQLVKRFYPDQNPQHKIDVAFMLHSPDVKVKGFNLSEEYLATKKNSARLTLTCLEAQVMDEIEESDFVDRIVGRLSLEGGPQALGLDKIRHMLSALGMPYRDSRYPVPADEKKVLRKKLKSYARHSYDNAKKVDYWLGELDYAKMEYTVKEMLRLRIIETNQNGVYSFNKVPFGTAISDILRTWETDPALKESMLKKFADTQN